MAATNDSNGQDMRAAEATYESFLSLLKTGTIIAAATTALVMLLLTSG